MKRACSTCPFRESAPDNMWHPYNIISIAYLGCADVPAPVSMLCHHSGEGVTNPGGATSRLCVGWVKAAAGTTPVNIALSMHGLTMEDFEFDDELMMPEKFAWKYGIETSTLPDLTYPMVLEGTAEEKMAVLDGYAKWAQSVMNLKLLLGENMDYSYIHLKDDSPLHTEIDDEEVIETFGAKAGERLIAYRDQQ